MLEPRPIREHGATDLPPASTAAMIWSFECTSGRTCVADVLRDLCPDCSVGFVPRPVRPAREWRRRATVAVAPASTRRRHRPVDPAEHAGLRDLVGGLAPHERRGASGRRAATCPRGPGRVTVHACRLVITAPRR